MSMTAVDHALVGVDLNGIFAALSMIGTMLSAALMQVTWHSEGAYNDSMWLRWIRRFAIMCIGLALAWTLSYSLAREWQPWPPMVALVLALNVNFAIRIVTIKLRERRGDVERIIREHRLAIHEIGEKSTLLSRGKM
jgi:uncharacterized membrane protein AbrB (regulator of aidB expression)